MHALSRSALYEEMPLGEGLIAREDFEINESTLQRSPKTSELMPVLFLSQGSHCSWFNQVRPNQRQSSASQNRSGSLVRRKIRNNSLTPIAEAGLKVVSSKGLFSDDPVKFTEYPRLRATWENNKGAFRGSTKKE